MALGHVPDSANYARDGKAMTSHNETIYYKNAQGMVEQTNKPEVVKSTFTDL